MIIYIFIPWESTSVHISSGYMYNQEGRWDIFVSLQNKWPRPQPSEKKTGFVSLTFHTACRSAIKTLPQPISLLIGMFLSANLKWNSGQPITQFGIDWWMGLDYHGTALMLKNSDLYPVTS